MRPNGMPIFNTNISGVPKNNVPVSHKQVLESCLFCCSVSKYEVLFRVRGTLYGTEGRFLGHPKL